MTALLIALPGFALLAALVRWTMRPSARDIIPGRYVRVYLPGERSFAAVVDRVHGERVIARQLDRRALLQRGQLRPTERVVVAHRREVRPI